MKTLLVGLDGFDASLTRQWISEGKLPNLARLATWGRMTVADSLVPPISPAVWTTILTGLGPAAHGVYDFTIMEGGLVRLPGRLPREVPNLFEILSFYEKKIVAIGFPGSEPLSPINGVLIPGWESPVTPYGGGSVHGAWQLHSILVERFGKEYLPFDVIDQFRGAYGAEAADGGLRLVEAVHRRVELCLYILKKGPVNDPDLLAVYFPEADAAGHQMWHLHDQNSPRAKQGASKEPGKGRGGAASRKQHPDPLEQVYSAIDESLELLIAAYRPEAIIAVSDHGMGGNSTTALSLNRLLIEAGHTYPSSRGSWPLFDLVGQAMLSGLSALPERARGLLLAQGIRKLSDRALTMLRLGGLDLKHSLAFSEDLSHAPSVWISPEVAARHGLTTAEAAQIVRSDLSEGLSKRGVNATIYCREELYKGPFIERIPHLLVDIHPDVGGYSFCLVPGLFRTMKGPLAPLPPFFLSGQKGRSRHANHRPGCLLLSVGEPFKDTEEHIGIYDIAPLILSFTGAPASRKETTIRSSCSKGTPPDEALVLDHHKLRSRLEALGYL